MGKGDHSRYLATPLLKLGLIDKLLLEYVGLTYVLDLAVQLVNLFVKPESKSPIPKDVG